MKKISWFLIVLFILNNYLFIFGATAKNNDLPVIPLRGESSKEKKDKNYKEKEIIVQYKSKNKKEKALDKIKNKTDKEELSLEVKGEVDDGLNMILIKSETKSTEDLIEEFKEDDDVEFVEPNFKRELTFAPNDNYFPLQWSLQNSGQIVDGVAGTNDADIDAAEAWDIESSGATDTIVAILDDGIEYNYSDLANNMWNGTACVDDLGNTIAGGCPNHGWDYEDLDNDPHGTEHGTFIASLIAGEYNNTTGVAGLSRYNNIKLMALKFDLTVFTEIQAINFAKNNGAKVISASFGGIDYSAAEKAAIDSFNGIFATSSGNEGVNNETTPSYPCNHTSSNIICVGSSTQNDTLSSFSNYGTTSVDIVAPGENMIGRYLGDYYVGDGTSFATPLVAGTAALLYAHRPAASVITIRSTILQSSDRISSLSSYVTDGKRLNMHKAIQSINSTDATLMFNQENISITAGQTFSMVAKVDPGTNEIGGVELDINFNSSVLRLDSITKSNNFNLTLAGPTINNTTGTGSIDVGLLTNPATYITDISDIATFTFTALAPANNSEISFATSSNASAHGSYVVTTRIPSRVNITQDATRVPAYRFYNKINDRHFFTTNEAEKNTLLTSLSYWWNYEGISFYVNPAQSTGTVPVYRFYNKINDRHFFTTNEAEKNTLLTTLSYWWNYEGISFYVYPN